MTDDDSNRITKRMRLVHVLNCENGVGITPKGNRTIAIVTFGCGEDVDVPMALYPRDVAQLTVSFLRWMATNGSNKAEHILDRFSLESGSLHEWMGDSVAAKLSQPHAAPPSFAIDVPGEKPEAIRNRRIVTPQNGSILPFVKATGIKIVLRLRDRKVRPLNFDVLGGYRSAENIMLVLRSEDLGNVIEVVGEVRSHRRLALKDCPKDSVIPLAQWNSLWMKKPGYKFRIGRKRCWFRMSVEELQRALRIRVFRIAEPS